MLPISAITPLIIIVTFTPGVAQPAATNAVVVTFDAGIKLPTVVNVGFLTSGTGIGGGAAITTDDLCPWNCSRAGSYN